MWQRTMIFIATVLLLGAGQQLWRSLDSVGDRLDGTTSRLDVRIENFTMRFLDSDGREQLRIDSPLLTDHGAGSPTDIEQPVIITSQGRKRWRIEADRGILDPGRNEAELIDKVIIRSLNMKPPLQLETRYLKLQIENKTIHTPELVTITRPNMQLRGVGLQGDIDSARYQLLDNVNGTYVDQ